jgi:HEAT repeat protein
MSEISSRSSFSNVNPPRHVMPIGRPAHVVSLLIAILVSLASGCGQNKQPDTRAGRIIGPSQQAPSYAAARNVPLDPALRADADRELRVDLQSSDPEIRAHALEALQKNGADDSRQITAALGDTDPLVRYSGCIAAGQIQLKSAHDALLALADDHTAVVRVVARYALHRIGDYRYSHDLEALSRDPEPQVRGTTAMVLGMLGDPSGLKILRSMRTDRHPAVRQQASAAMWQLGDQQGMADLIGWSISQFPDDQMFGLLALSEPRHRTIIQHVRIGLVRDRPEVTLAAARGMGMLGSDEGYAIAMKGVSSVDPSQRIEAALALGAIGRSDSQGALRKLLGDSNANVRIAAAEAIFELKPDFMPG